MINLIMKDIKFNSKYVLIGLGLLIVTPIVIAYNESTIAQMYAVILYFPMFFINIIIGKTCYLEDSDNTKRFLQSLPVSRNTLIGSRYCETLIVTFIAVGYCAFIEKLLYFKGADGALVLAIIAISIYLIYYALYLFLFFTKNYQVAQQSMTIFVMGFLIVVGILSAFKINIAVIINFNFAIGLLFIASLAFIASFIGVTKHK